jgi:hypothetical protein
MTSKKIIIKEIDKYTSQNFKDKTISEYIIYLMDGDVKLAAYTEIGEQAKKERTHMILLSSFPITLTKEQYKDVVEEITNN